MIRIALVTVLLWAGIAGADSIYRWENKDGTVVYSDEPPPKSTEASKIEPEELPALQVIPSLDVPAPAPPAADQAAKPSRAYEYFSISQPQAESSIRANDGSVTIALSLQPSLSTAAGHSIHLYLDGNEIAQGAQTSFRLNDVDRGTHSLRAEVKTRDGETLISTNTITFTLLRYSRLF
jgi:hypothetical protein